MAKNDTKTIFNVLSAKARKKEITNTDRKEVRQAVADLAAEIQGGYRLGRQEFDTFNRVYDVYREDMNEAFRNLPDESRKMPLICIRNQKIYMKGWGKNERLLILQKE